MHKFLFHRLFEHRPQHNEITKQKCTMCIYIEALIIFSVRLMFIKRHSQKYLLFSGQHNKLLVIGLPMSNNKKQVPFHSIKENRNQMVAIEVLNNYFTLMRGRFSINITNFIGNKPVGLIAQQSMVLHFCQSNSQVFDQKAVIIKHALQQHALLCSCYVGKCSSIDYTLRWNMYAATFLCI